MTCTFFGHKDTPGSVKDKLREAIINLIELSGVDMFYVGTHGSFDRMAASILQELTGIYPNIDYRIVLAYLPNNKNKDDLVNLEKTEFPEGIETAPKRFAIDFRNRWMLMRADTVVAYVSHDWGGAAKFVQLAERKQLPVLNLFNTLNKLK